MFALLAYGTVKVFLILDANSHSASDTLRPFLLRWFRSGSLPSGPPASSSARASPARGPSPPPPSSVASRPFRSDACAFPIRRVRLSDQLETSPDKCRFRRGLGRAFTSDFHPDRRF